MLINKAIVGENFFLKNFSVFLYSRELLQLILSYLYLYNQFFYIDIKCNRLRI